MSEFQENEKMVESQDVEETQEIKEEYHDELDQFTSIFSDPEEHNDKPHKRREQQR